jgi:hypothetical protein
MQWVTGAFSPGIKWSGRDFDPSPSITAEVKNVWVYTSTPPYVLVVQCLIKYRNSFTFDLLLPELWHGEIENWKSPEM